MISDTSYKTSKWRSIGPFRGGRSVAGSGVVGDPSTYYMGNTGGGLWKTEDMGITWNNISDGFFKSGSVGAIAVAKSDKNVIYVGMGEHAIRGVMTHHGDGVYKSTNAGKTWSKIGLDLSQHISRIIIDPLNSDIVYVAVQGALYGKSDQRGLFKTIDGGVTWKKILYVDDKTGCVELSMDANNSRILYAAMWEHGRLPNKIISGGPSSSLYKSTDSGLTWNKINNGLPSILGKMSIAVCPSNSEKVYALVEGDSEKEEGGLFVSENSGESWSRITNDHRLVQRAWYYIELFIDPKNENNIYVLNASALYSNNGGKTWETITGTHGDHHDLWINPDNSKNLALANDGGVAITFNGGKSWSSQDRMPTSQIYRLNADNLFPYNIYSGQQDNSSLKIASRSFSGSISEENWSASAGGESAFMAFDPSDPTLVLGGSYLGTIDVYDSKTETSTKIMAAPIQYLAMEPQYMKYRYNWNAPIVRLKHEPNSYIHAAQKLLKTTDLGQTWTEISPDLTRNDKSKQGKGGGPLTNEIVGAENYGTIAYVMESPLEAGVIWTGSDDGLVQLTKDGGKTWANVTPKGLSECLVNAIEVSPHDKATAYIATTRYKFNDHTPGIYKTTDYGQSWKLIINGIGKDAFTRVVREDEVVKNLLFAGTESGLYISTNGGENWFAFQMNLPLCPITDLKIHKDDLIASTSGRSIWIYDDLPLLRQRLLSVNKFGLYQSREAYLVNGYSPLNSTNASFKGSSNSVGVNPANGVVIYYELPDISKESTLTLSIKNQQGKVVRSYSSKADSTFTSWDGGPNEEPVLSKEKGLNRFVWDLRNATIKGVPDTYYEASFKGHRVSPGMYTLILSDGTNNSEIKVNVLSNPLVKSAQKEIEQYDAVMIEMENNVNKMHSKINNIYNYKNQLSAVLGKINDTKHDDLKAFGKDLLNKMTLWDNDMVQRLSKAYDDVENFPNKFAANYMFVLNHAENDVPKVNQSTYTEKSILDGQWLALNKRADDLIQVELKKFNSLLCEKGLNGIF
jgi:photosystem II stability/assembly factor-like uncharacterized protein